ncbi:aldehyde dehydrogenase family protein [Undibacterium arcticum]
MLKLADLIEAHGEELAHLETLNNGKLFGLFAHVRSRRQRAMVALHGRLGNKKISGSTLDLSLPLPPHIRTRASTQRVPVGVVGAIIPWNFPLLMAVWKVAPALACGCTVVLKPAEETPLTALRLGELALEAGLPRGALNVVTGRGETAGAALVKHPAINKIAFTGSTEVGRIIGAVCGENLKRVSLELGGKSPVIVLDDCDPQAAAEGAASAIFFSITDRYALPAHAFMFMKKIYSEVVDRLVVLANNMVVGSGLHEGSHMGPLVSEHHHRRVLKLIETGVDDGAELLCGGGMGGPGYFVKPTIFLVTVIIGRFVFLEQEVFRTRARRHVIFGQRRRDPFRQCIGFTG